MRLLSDAGIGIASPTLVAREFNRRYPGKPVTAQAVPSGSMAKPFPDTPTAKVDQ